MGRKPDADKTPLAAPAPAPTPNEKPKILLEVAYACPLCAPSVEGIADQRSNRPTIVYLSCPKCGHKWAATRVKHAKRVFCKIPPDHE